MDEDRNKRLEKLKKLEKVLKKVKAKHDKKYEEIPSMKKPTKK